MLEIYPNGDLDYSGMRILHRAGDPKTGLLQLVNVVGTRHAKLTRDQLMAVTKYFLSLPFADCYRGEDDVVFDIGSALVYFDSAAGTRIRVNSPVFFNKTLSKINDFVDIKDWICFPKGHPDVGDCRIPYKD